MKFIILSVALLALHNYCSYGNNSYDECMKHCPCDEIHKERPTQTNQFDQFAACLKICGEICSGPTTTATKAIKEDHWKDTNAFLLWKIWNNH